MRAAAILLIAFLPGLSPAQPLPAAPPSPTVQLLIVTPLDAPPTGEYPVSVRVTNATAATAYKVVVRVPLPASAEIGPAEPKAVTGLKELVWKFDKLAANETQTIEFKVKPKADAKDVTLKGFVSFEHGQQVVTRINPPKLKVKTDAPKTAAGGDAIPVRVLVTNDGKVAIKDAKLTANISAGFDFHRDTAGEKGKTAQQRIIDLGTLAPGQAKTVEYRVMGKGPAELLVMSVISGSHQSQVEDAATVGVKDARLKIEASTVKADGADDLIECKLKVWNPGTLPLTNVRVTGTVPDGCEAKRITYGAEITRDGVVSKNGITWVIPKLIPDDKPFEFRYRLRGDPGRKTVRASAIAAQGVEDATTVEAVFVGSASLTWVSSFSQELLPRDKSAMLTVAVKNRGSDAAKDVKLVVTLSPKVELATATPEHKVTARIITFDPRTLKAGATEKYSIQFKANEIGQAFFTMELTDGATKAKPLTASPYVEITK